jgi:hypothetical protein
MINFFRVALFLGATFLTSQAKELNDFKKTPSTKDAQQHVRKAWLGREEREKKERIINQLTKKHSDCEKIQGKILKGLSLKDLQKILKSCFQEQQSQVNAKKSTVNKTKKIPTQGGSTSVTSSLASNEMTKLLEDSKKLIKKYFQGPTQESLLRNLEDGKSQTNEFVWRFINKLGKLEKSGEEIREIIKNPSAVGIKLGEYNGAIQELLVDSLLHKSNLHDLESIFLESFQQVYRPVFFNTFQDSLNFQPSILKTHSYLELLTSAIQGSSVYNDTMKENIINDLKHGVCSREQYYDTGSKDKTHQEILYQILWQLWHLTEFIAEKDALSKDAYEEYATTIRSMGRGCNLGRIEVVFYNYIGKLLKAIKLLSQDKEEAKPSTTTTTNRD